MSSAIIFHEPVFATIVESGDRLFFYEVGTSTDLEVYLDAALTTPAPQPLTADAAGRFPPIYLDSTGNEPKVVLNDSDDVEKWTADEYPFDDLTSVSGDVAQIQSDLEQVEGDVLALQASDTQQDADIADHETRITTLEDDNSLAPIQEFINGFAASAQGTGHLVIPYSSTNAILLNWGSDSCPFGTKQITWDREFTTVYQAFCSYGSQITEDDCCYLFNESNTGATIGNTSTATYTVNWFAVGRLAL